MALRDQLRGVGFDYLVRRPIHPGALRLLLLRALYRGPERRVTVRYPIGGEVAYKLGLRRRRATLLEVSLRGCRLQAARARSTPTPASPWCCPRISRVRSPSRCRAGWCAASPTPRGSHELAVAFEALSNRVERSLRDGAEAQDPGPGSRTAGRPADRAERPHRRAGGRRTFQQARFGDAGPGRPRPGRPQTSPPEGCWSSRTWTCAWATTPVLEIFGRDGDDAVRVQARVVRDDESGMALQFVADVLPSGEALAERLEAPGGETEACRGRRTCWPTPRSKPWGPSQRRAPIVDEA